ncbi:hypothetical protein OROGR_019759 [Orobanche gracilis]
MDALKKQASKLREQVAKQQQGKCEIYFSGYESLAVVIDEFEMPHQKTNPGFYSNQAQIHTLLSYHHLQAAMFQQMKQQRMMMMKNRFTGQGSLDYQLQNGSIVGGRDDTYGLSVSTWPKSQQSRQLTGSDRVVRALNVNMDSIDAQVYHRDRGVGNLTADYEK